MYTLRYMRSMPSTSSVTCSRRTSATVRGACMGGSLRQGLWGPTNRVAVQGTLPAYPFGGTTGACLVHLVGLRRSLVRFSVTCATSRIPTNAAEMPGVDLANWMDRRALVCSPGIDSEKRTDKVFAS